MTVGETNFALFFRDSRWKIHGCLHPLGSQFLLKVAFGFSYPDIASTHSSPSDPHSQTASVSEASVVRLDLNALQGVQAALISSQKLSAAFCSEPADQTFHQIPSLWNRSSSTYALGVYA
ncbi:hypothetical protein HS088_TW07G00607 [Tripterygium wilfordii]|uniref:Uncharacterized protein n=1 Tax=Tripterygium wilfordii TaxID=458696 RepID=A0A7J7DG48_TRIWF|nr:hypothetical protein HS088_TW07G00607 [Tripterygium wilfordii]